jgi:hypothetical protein
MCRVGGESLAVRRCRISELTTPLAWSSEASDFRLHDNEMTSQTTNNRLYLNQPICLLSASPTARSGIGHLAHQAWIM